MHFGYRPEKEGEDERGTRDGARCCSWHWSLGCFIEDWRSTIYGGCLGDDLGNGTALIRHVMKMLYLWPDGSSLSLFRSTPLTLWCTAKQ